ncbi:thioredoxin O2, mitochondrial isoform X1 [Neltuma alba]|uniref:thioredoxin O2, mitochondrial isoform X1 n=1 Tax=Neltuma alba TaxID=207710 RepID=UPI0010A4F4DC|nr:thioredoxin O2, mitochondrial-like isoform X1 [Prosopis alba]
MARNLNHRSSVFRWAIENRIRPIFNHVRSDSVAILTPASTTIYPSPPSKSLTSSSFSTIASITPPLLSVLLSSCNFRRFGSASGASNIVLVKTEEEFNDILSKVQDQSLPAIFYFTAVWCGPCRFISPVIEELSGKYPHVTTYKIDIDQEAIQGTLGKLMITSVPTLHFFQNGKKADELIGADVARLNSIVEKLFKKD